MDDSKKPDITQILAKLARGDDLAAEALLPLLYDELHGLAGRCFRGQSPAQTLQPTALVHEAYLRLSGKREADWESRAHFLAVAAKAMRQILANHAKAKRTAKRGGDRLQVTLAGLATPIGIESQIDLIDLDDALTRLAQLSPRQAQIVEMRFLTGLEENEVARVLDVSTRTVQREWRMARAFLKCELGGDSLS